MQSANFSPKGTDSNFYIKEAISPVRDCFLLIQLAKLSAETFNKNKYDKHL